MEEQRHPDADLDDELVRVYLNRFREAQACGMTRLEARLFAESDIDIGQLRRLKAKGCPPCQFARVLL